MSLPPSKGEDWRKCVDWLVRCNVIPSNHHVAGPSAQLLDLAILLRDGVLLCCLLNALQPGSVDSRKFSQNPQTSLFLYKRNVKTFLDTCTTSFGLQPRELFNTFDLMEVSNFHLVIETLSILSQSPRALESKIASFRISENNNSSSPDYQNILQDDLSDNDECFNAGIYANIKRVQDEDVYGRLMDYARLPATTSPPAKDVKPKTHAELCVKEVLDTEKTFLKILTMIRDKFMGPLKTVFTLTDYDIIFKHIDTLYTVHSEFQEQLLSANSEYSRISISDCFIMFKERFLIYGDFCTNLPKATKLVEQLCKANPLVKSSVTRCENHANDGFCKLQDLLTVPMQRVLKYHLFLKELSKYHKGERQWNAAVAEIEDLSLFINEVVRDNGMLENLGVIETSISGWQRSDNRTLKDYGRLQMDGELKIKGRKSKRHVFLLDHLILICTPRGESYELESYLEVLSIEVDNQVTQEKNFSNYVITLRKQGSTAEVFGAKTLELAKNWITSIQMALDNVRPEFALSNGHEFVMKSFSSPTICDVCRKLLRGTFFQGYKCLKTAKCVHKECIEKAKNIAKPQIVERGSSISNSSQRSARSMPAAYVDIAIQSDKTTTVIPSTPTRKSMSYDSTAFDFPSGSGYAGNIDRAQAETILISKPLGMFIIRTSTRVGELALSINVGQAVRHIIINKSPEGQFFFKAAHKFSSLDDLVHHYQNNTLAELSMTLGLPFMQKSKDGLSNCTAVYNYAATNPSQLSLKEGDRITILAKTAESNGWWKGEIGSRVGYFPYAYVVEDGENVE